MNPREAKRKLSIQQWRQIIQDQRNSGLYVDDYCTQNNLSRHAYFYWLRIIRQQAIDEADSPIQESPQKLTVSHAPADFVEVRLNDTASNGLPMPVSSNGFSQLALSINGITVHVTEATPSALLLNTLEVIKHVQ